VPTDRLSRRDSPTFRTLAHPGVPPAQPATALHAGPGDPAPPFRVFVPFHPESVAISDARQWVALRELTLMRQQACSAELLDERVFGVA